MSVLCCSWLHACINIGVARLSINFEMYIIYSYITKCSYRLPIPGQNTNFQSSAYTILRLTPPPQSLLSYGASPDYRDAKGLTPLYHTAIMGDDPGACITLLRYRAEIGVKDQGGWSELHHVSVT